MNDRGPAPFQGEREKHVDERVQQERPCRTLFVRNVNVSPLLAECVVSRELNILGRGSILPIRVAFERISNGSERSRRFSISLRHEGWHLSLM